MSPYPTSYPAQLSEQFRLIVDALPVPISYIDAEKRYRLVNAAYEKWFGRPREEVIGKSVTEVLGAQAAATLAPYMDAALSGKVTHFEAEAGSEDGGTRLFSTTYVPDRAPEGGSARGFAVLVEDMTTRKTESARLAAIVRASIDAIVSEDLNSVVNSWNEAATRIFGYEASEAIGKPITIIIPEDRRYEEGQLIATVKQGRPIEHYETVRMTKSGRRIDVSLSLFPIRDHSGQIVGAAKVARDITERKRAEKELKEAKEFRETIVNTARVLLVGLNEDGKIVFFNKACEDVTRWKKEEVLGKDWFSTFLPQRFRPAVGTVFRDLMEQSGGGQYENPILTKSGEERWIAWNNAILKTSPGGGLMVLGTGVDITERKNAEDALKHSEAELRAYAESMPQMAFIADAEGHILYFNRRHYEYFGIKPGVSEGWTWRDQQLHHPEDVERTVTTWRESLETGKPYQIEYRLRRHDGVFRWHLGRAVPARDETGRITRWFGTNTDIHDQKEAARKLEETLHLRDEFISIASHELKTPITSLRMQIQVLDRTLKKQGFQAISPERLARTFDASMKQLDRLTRLVEDMLDLTRISSRKLTFEMEEHDLSQSTQDVLERFQENCRESSCTIHAEIEPGIIGYFDRFRIEQVIGNLVSNAIKYGAGKPVHVALRKKDPVTAELVVRDQGIGIPKEAQRRIFERFERAVSVKSISGLGLGLYIVRNILDAHHGSIRVESQVGQGSTFTVEFPLGLAQEERRHRDVTTGL